MLLDDFGLLTLVWQKNNVSMNFQGGKIPNVNSVLLFLANVHGATFILGATHIRNSMICAKMMTGLKIRDCNKRY